MKKNEFYKYVKLNVVSVVHIIDEAGHSSYIEVILKNDDSERITTAKGEVRQFSSIETAWRLIYESGYTGSTYIDRMSEECYQELAENSK